MLAIILVGLCLSPLVSAAPLDLQTFDTHTRLSVNLDSGVTAESNFTNLGFSIVFKDLSLVDLGAPFGNEKAWLKTLNLAGDSRVGNLTLSETQSGVVLSGKWKFPSGQAALAKPEMEVFSFRDKEPSRFVIDLWVKKGLTLLEVRRREIEAQKRREDEIRRAMAQKAEQRTLAFYHEEARAQEVEDFCRGPVSEANDGILAFRPAHPKVDFRKWFPLTIADEEFRYTQPDPILVEKSKEAQYVQLALKLYGDGRPALAVKTVEFLKREYPGSKWLPEMQFMTANALKRLGHEEAYFQELETIASQFRGAPIGHRAIQFLAVQAYERGEYMKAMELFMAIVRDYPKSKNLWVYRLGIAESLYEVRQTERAAKEYQWILENTDETQAQAEAAFRSGDLYLDRRQYEQALASYYRGLKHFGNQSKAFPEVHVNHAESLYGLGQYDRAAELFRSFLSNFPGHPAGWRATYRIGEILARKAEASDREASRKWFYDTINFFPMSKGAVLGRLKLLPCGDHGGYTQVTADRFFREQAERFEGGLDVDMTGYADVLALTKVRTLSVFGDPSAALKVGVQAMAARLGVVAQKEITAILRNEFKREIHNLLDSGKSNQALALYRNYSPFLSQNDEALSPYFVLRLSGAAADLSLGKLAMSLVKDYETRRNEYEKYQKSQRMLASSAPGTPNSEEDVLSEGYFEKRLLTQEYAMAQARAVWLSDRSAEAVKAHLTNVTDQSAAAFDKEILLSVLESESDKSEAALEHAQRAASYLPDLEKRRRGFSEGRAPQLSAWIAFLQAKAKKSGESIASYQGILKTLEDTSSSKTPVVLTHPTLTGVGIPGIPERSEILARIASLHEDLGQWDLAANAYDAAMKAGRTGPSTLFSYGRALERSPAAQRRKQALDVFQKIIDAPSQSDKDEFWKSLAKQKLATQSLESNQGG